MERLRGAETTDTVGRHRPLRAEPGQEDVPAPTPSPAAAVWHTLWPVVTQTAMLALQAAQWLLRNVWKHTLNLCPT